MWRLEIRMVFDAHRLLTMSSKLAPYTLTQDKALSSVQKTLMRTWDEAQEAFDEVGESPLSSQLTGLVETLTEQATYLISADTDAGLYGLHNQVVGLLNVATGLKNLLNDADLSKAFNASHLVAAAQLEGGLDVHILNAYHLEETEDGKVFLEAPRNYLTPDDHMNPNMRAAANALVALGKINPKVIDALPDVSPASLLDTDADEEEGSE